MVGSGFHQNPFVSPWGTVARVLWLHFPQGSCCIPRKLRSIRWSLQRFSLKDIKHTFRARANYSCPGLIPYFSPDGDLKELEGGGNSIFHRMISVARGGAKLCHLRTNPSPGVNRRAESDPALNQLDRLRDHEKGMKGRKYTWLEHRRAL